MQATKAASERCTDQEQSFAIVLWGWLRSHMADYNGQKGELFAIEEVGELLYGKQRGNHAKFDPTDASAVPVSLKTQGPYVSQRHSPTRIKTLVARHILQAKDSFYYSDQVSDSGLEEATLTQRCAQTSST